MTGNQLRYIIEKRGVSITAMAYAMGLSSQMALQSTLRSPDIKSGHLEAAAKALGMTIPEMYAMLDGDQSSSTYQKQQESNETSEAPAASSDMQQVLLHLVALVSDQNKKIDDLTKQIADQSSTYSRCLSSLTDQISSLRSELYTTRPTASKYPVIGDFKSTGKTSHEAVDQTKID